MIFSKSINEDNHMVKYHNYVKDSNRNIINNTDSEMITIHYFLILIQNEITKVTIRNDIKKEDKRRMKTREQRRKK